MTGVFVFDDRSDSYSLLYSAKEAAIRENNNIRDLINDNKFDELEIELKKINYIKNILNGINL